MAHWVMHPEEVVVFDANARHLDVSIRDLMQAAGQALAAETVRLVETSEAPEHREIWILCGPGNNGGDGFAAALSLHESGHAVRLIASHVTQKGQAAESFRNACRETPLSIDVWPMVPIESKPRAIIDCLLGAGAGGSAPRGDVSELLEWIRPYSASVNVIACDLPTGFGTNTVLSATSTVTFHAEKIGMRDATGSMFSTIGSLRVAPLPWPDEVLDCGPGDALRYPPLDPDARKGDRGRLLIVGGGPYHGAPILSGDAAARSGCDLVHVAMPSEARSRADWPPHLIPESIPDEVSLTIDSVEHLLGRILSGRGVQAMVIGPGLGRGDRVAKAVERLIEVAIEKSVPLVIDADAISVLPKGRWPDGMIGILTPHLREAEEWIGSEPAAIREELDQSTNPEDRVVLLTGPVDRLFGPHGRGALGTGGHPRMAVGGTGDLLAGICGGLLAQGMAPWPAARLASALLREAGAAAALERGPGLVAGDVPPHIASTLTNWI